jgi:prolyl-tRNA synthetase
LNFSEEFIIVVVIFKILGINSSFLDKGFKGWVLAGWCKPTGAALDAVDQRLKALKLTIRNAPLDLSAAQGTCLFTGAPAVESVLIARSY